MADVDPVELRRLAEAATTQPTPNWWASSGAMLRYLAATSPDVVLALLDRIDALEALLAHHRRAVSDVPGLLARVDAAFSHTADGGPAHQYEVNALYDVYRWAEALHESSTPSADPGAVAGEPGPLPESRYGGVPCPSPTHGVVIPDAGPEPYCGRCGWLIGAHPIPAGEPESEEMT